ncbi:hypothetical protein BDZ97DRAFT_1907538 [Flammula alnicola]|nr:hypothetical protein BDZ97DRAFT_1907538 [Flammula alnicola]
MPQIWNRPAYPSFLNDSRSDKASKKQRREECNRFYAKYGESHLTGRIMSSRCRHSVCYGFHCIFIIIYDFTCALQPYCMSQELEYIAHTLFLINTFHCIRHTKCGHDTKCGHATFLMTYCEADPHLLAINTSAAKCGNRDINYMSQDRAVLFTKVFLSIWNCLHLQKMQKS